MADLYDPLARLVDLLDLEQSFRPHDRDRAVLVWEAGCRLCGRLTPWWSPIRDVPSRSQIRDGWYWDDRMQPCYLPRSRPPRPRIY